MKQVTLRPLSITLLVAACAAAPPENETGTQSVADPAAPTASHGSASDAVPVATRDEPLRGWLNWRGPDQNGTSPETGLFDQLTLDGENHMWSYPIAGRGTPVGANGRIYGLGYVNPGAEMQEVLYCLDADSGELLWEHRWPDFLTDVIYTRYAIGSPTIDPENGNVYALTGAGLVHGFTPDGELLWQQSMAETLGRLSFPNGRVGAPMILDDLVIVHFIFAAWGPFGPARDRFFAFDKYTGEVVWGCTPGGPPKDSSFSMPVVEERNGRTLIYAGLGGGHVACVDARTGEPVWRFPLSIGGINSSALLHGDRLIVLHGKENRDSSTIGRMVALDLTKKPGGDGVLGDDAEVWRNPLVAFTSSPVLVGDRVYATTLTGDLNCVDANTGEVMWHEKLGPDQLHASPVYADGKLYVPLTNGTFHIVRPSDEGAEVLDMEQLEGSCLGAPAVIGGRVLVQTTEKLYCFGADKGDGPEWPARPRPEAGKAARLQIVPADVTARVGDPVPYRVRRLDEHGRVVDERPGTALSGEVPPIASSLEPGSWIGTKPGVGVFKAQEAGMVGTARLRIVPSLPHSQDFESMELDQADGEWAFPPGHWLGGRMKWQAVDHDGSRVIMRRMDNPLFQRTMTLIGHPDDSNYTVQVDVKSDGSRRSLSTVGVVNQRYLIILKGNHQELEVSSNMEHLKVAVPFRWRAGVWYRLKTRVDLQDDGSAVVRAKAWNRDEPEPEEWTTEVVDPHGHRNGAAGLYGFTPQSRYTVYLDNLTVTPNE